MKISLLLAESIAICILQWNSNKSSNYLLYVKQKHSELFPTQPPLCNLFCRQIPTFSQFSKFSFSWMQRIRVGSLSCWKLYKFSKLIEIDWWHMRSPWHYRHKLKFSEVLRFQVEIQQWLGRIQDYKESRNTTIISALVGCNKLWQCNHGSL